MFRSKEKFGLGITSLTNHFERMQLIKCALLQSSVDLTVQKLNNVRAEKNAKLVRVWKASNLSRVASAEVDLNLKFPTQNSNQGIGFGNFNPHPTKSEKRKLITTKAFSFSQQKKIAHAMSLKRQGNWLQWSEDTLPFDFSWQHLIWSSNNKIISFVLNATVNWIRTPDLLHLWGFKQSASCCLCAHEKCTLHHILSNCPKALTQQRYTWRHDSVLQQIHSALSFHITQLNSSTNDSKPLHISQCFVKAGSSNYIVRTKKTGHKRTTVLDGAQDWKLLADFHNNNYVFPPEILSTNLRPDILIWSQKKHKVIILELTCPAEEGMSAAKTLKEAKYLPLITDIINTNQWTVSFFTIEVGVRGFVNNSFWKCFLSLGLSRQIATKLCKKVSLVSAKCSYFIYLAANSPSWEENKSLLTVEDA